LDIDLCLVEVGIGLALDGSAAQLQIVLQKDQLVGEAVVLALGEGAVIGRRGGVGVI
jgi:hypothetical protein